MDGERKMGKVLWLFFPSKNVNSELGRGFKTDMMRGKGYFSCVRGNASGKLEGRAHGNIGVLEQRDSKAQEQGGGLEHLSRENPRQHDHCFLATV